MIVYIAYNKWFVSNHFLTAVTRVVLSVFLYYKLPYDITFLSSSAVQLLAVPAMVTKEQLIISILPLYNMPHIIRVHAKVRFSTLGPLLVSHQCITSLYTKGIAIIDFSISSWQFRILGFIKLLRSLLLVEQCILVDALSTPLNQIGQSVLKMNKC